jgi:hypothetical protein
VEQRKTYVFEFYSAPSLDRLLDPDEDFAMSGQITSDDGERLAVVIVHELVAHSVAKDHGRIARKFAIQEGEGILLVGFVEDRDCGSGLDAGVFSVTLTDKSLGS